jgi:hypothetical protein
LAYDVLE